MLALAGVQLIKRLLLLVALSAPCTAQTVLLSFDGDQGLGTFNHPNDSMGANGTYVAMAGQQAFSVYDYATGNQQLTVDMTTFINNAGVTAGKVLDPRIVYDCVGTAAACSNSGTQGRWIVGCSCANDFLIVSSGPNPITSTWKAVPLSTATGDLSVKLGFDKNWVYISEYYAPTAKHTEFAIPQADVAWSGAGNVSLAHMVSANGATLDTYPEIDLNPSKALTAPGYFVSRQNESQGGTNVAFSLAIDTFTPTSATAGSLSNPASPTLVSTGFLYNGPLNVNQPSAPLISGQESHRPFEVYVGSDNQLNVVFGSGPCTTSVAVCGAQGQDTQQLVMWFQVAIPALTLTQKAKMSNSGIAYVFPSVVTDSSGNVTIVASGAGSSQPASIYGFYHLTTDAAGVLHGPNLLRAGTGTYSCLAANPVNWGTYSFAVQDPSDGTKFWAIQEYNNSATGCNWFTRFIQMQLAAVPPGIAPTGNFNGVIVGGASR
jgi:hypothetical protein